MKAKTYLEKVQYSDWNKEEQHPMEMETPKQENGTGAIWPKGSQRSQDQSR
jgi:hypothetical protein